jgi:hypothetical protein
MDTSRNRLSAARRYLQVLEESWQADHQAAMECRDVEDRLAEAIRVFDLVYDLVLRRRQCVYRGLAESNPTLDGEEKKLFGDWVALADQLNLQLTKFESNFGTVQGADEIRTCLEKAHAFLARWVPAAAATAIGSRVIDFSETDAQQIHALLQSPAGAVGRPTRPPRSVPEANPSLLK